MDYAFIRKASRSLMIIGIITLFFNSMLFVFVGSNRIGSYVIFAGIAISTIIMAIGIKWPSRIIAYFQIVGTFILAFFSFLDEPGNLAGIFLSIINYMLIVEYKMTSKLWHKAIIIFMYLIPAALSVLCLNRDYRDLPPLVLLTAFYCFFMYTYFEHKKKKDWNTIQKSISVIARLEPMTERLVKISKEQNSLIMEQAEQLEEYKKYSAASGT